MSDFALSFQCSSLTLNDPQQAAAKKSEREAMIAEWTLNVRPLHVIVKSEPCPLLSSLGVVSICFSRTFCLLTL